MAKHLGSPRQPRLRSVPRGLVWGLVLFLVVSALTVGAVVHGLGSQSPARVDLAGSRTAAETHASSGTTGGRARSGELVDAATRTTAASWRSDRGSTAPFRVHHGPALALTRQAVIARKAAAMTPTTSTFTIGQSNILGSQHTAGRGGFGPGTYRAGLTASLLTSRGTDLGGMQEVQSDQLGVLLNRMPAYSFWPVASLGHNGLRLQIYWRSSRFSLMQTGTVPYVFDSQRIPLPYVLLRDRGTGAEFWVITAHNSPGGMEAQRDYSTGIEIDLIRRLGSTGRPVIITGDMNEHSEFFCKVSMATGMVAANGGNGVGGCHLPPHPLRVDWIMGRGVTFSGYRQDAAGLGRASDHYYLYATATVASRFYAP